MPTTGDHIFPPQGAQSQPTAPTTFALILRAGPGCVDPIHSLRALLKTTKRRFGLICTSAVELDGEPSAVDLKGAP